jgi:hypothetical protein
VPPLAVIVALPVFPPKQFTSVSANTLAVSGAAGCVIVMLRVSVQPFASVTVAVHVPAESPVALVPFCAGVVFHTVV